MRPIVLRPCSSALRERTVARAQSPAAKGESYGRRGRQDAFENRTRRKDSILADATRGH
jgi:hypothetical protein